MNPATLDQTKLDQLANELGYTYRRGIKPGSGYNVIDDITGDTVLGDDDYTASLKAVKEFLDNVAKQLKAKAKALGYSFERDFEDRDGYVLIEDITGDKPLSDNYTATLKDIRTFLDNVASDLDVEVEVTKLPKVKPPSKQKLADALRGHKSADQIKEAVRETPPHQTKQQVHDRETLDNLLWVVNDPRASAAFYKQSAEVQRQHWIKLRDALERDERAKEAKLPKSTITIQDLEREERASQARKFHKINEKFRTNLDSFHDPMHERDRDWEVDNFRNPEKDHADWLAGIARENAAFIPPDRSTDYAPTPSTGFVRTSIGKRRKS